MVEKGSKSVKNYEITREVINLAELSICENVLEYSVQQEMMGMAYRARDLHASITGSNDKCWRGYVEYKNGLDELVNLKCVDEQTYITITETFPDPVPTVPAYGAVSY